MVGVPIAVGIFAWTQSASARFGRNLTLTGFVYFLSTLSASDDEIVYSINARQEFYLVRGDAAVLPTGATADTTRWYIRRWEDLAAPPAGVRKGPVINPAAGTTYGKVKASYR